ncbi:MAG TPA: AAA family ATPase, partial [Cytophagales bacterium]|nr:AAA family ATPase [Cytophagales bacterium]
CDEFGYVSFDKQGAEMLFTHLSLRAGRKSTIITTNLSFDRWSELFGAPVLTSALVDRLTHKAYLINMNGESFRLRETKALMKK